MRAFTPYKHELYSHIKNVILTNSSEKSAISTSTYINNKLRELIDLTEMRASGTFFTSDNLSKILISHVKSINSNSVILDPTCGVGDLLLSVSKLLPVERKLSKTLITWNKYLYGFDLYEEFVDATKLRLILEAINRNSIPDLNSIDDYISIIDNIRVGDVFNNNEVVKKATHFLMNPPFTTIKFDNEISWASGKVNSAAVFFEFCLNESNNNAHFCAILPEVLRSGTNYSKWRDLISSKISAEIKSYGQFDRNTNVDVFLLIGGKNSITGCDFNIPNSENSLTISDFFKVSVGPVVQHRSKEDGSLYPFITPKMIKSNNIVNTDDSIDKRKFIATLYEPPFLVIKRTSSPSDKIRAKACLVLGSTPVLVDNHFIIVKSINDDIAIYKKLLIFLQSTDISQYLNNNIRCRHLTTKVIKKIPLEENWINERED